MKHPTPPAAPSRMYSSEPQNAGLQANSLSTAWWIGEDAICLSALPRHLPHRHDGRRISVATCYRYALSGVCGVRLRRFRVGSGWATTLQEVSRWQRAVTLAKGGDV